MSMGSAGQRHRLGALSAEQRALLELRSRRKGLRLPSDSAIPRRADGADHPLSIDQERLWFIDRLTPGSTAYNIHLSCLLLGPLDISALERSFEEIVRRHESLRTTISNVAGRPQAIVHAPTGFRVLIEDLSALVSPTREAERERCLSRLANQPFDLEQGPLIRAALVKTGPHEHGLLVTMHHIMTDRVSLDVLARELGVLYGAFTQGRTSPLPELPIQYADFAAWQRRYLQGDVLEALVAYWTHQLEDAPFILTLPTDHRRSKVQQFSGMRRPFLLDRRVGADLRELARAEGVTPFMLYMAVLGLLLHRYAGQDEVLIGTPIANRSRAETRDLIGYLLTVLPVRVDLRGNPTFREVLTRVRTASLGLYSHQDLPFGELVDVLQVPRDLSRNPVFQVSLIYLEGGAVGLELPGLSVAPLAPEVLGSRFDLTVVIFDSDDGTLGLVEYRTDLWEAETIDRMISHLETLLGAVCAGIDTRVSDLPHLTEAERERLLISRNATERAAPEAGGYTPSDFPLARLDQETLDGLLGSGRGVEDVYPLSPMQEGMLFHTLMAPASGVYVEQGKFEMEGAQGAPAAAMRRAWERVVERHGVLRTHFAWEGLDRPLQVVERSVSLPWEEEDWRGLPSEEQERRFEELLKAGQERGFDLHCAPLMRLTLVRLGEEKHRLVWSFHHAILDGWCLPLLLNEVLGLYQSHTRGVGVELGEPRRYRDYIAWLEGQEPKAAERYWREALAGLKGPTPLVVGHPSRGDVGTGEGVGERRSLLSEEATRALESLGRRHGLTLDTLVHGAWALLLRRYSGERDVVFGVTVSGRPASLRGVETMVGLFINTLPLRVEVGDEQPILEWLKGLQTKQVEQRQWEHSSLAQVQKWSQVKAGQALFESLLAFENYPIDPSPLAFVLEPRVTSVIEKTSCPLTLLAGAAGPRLFLRFVFERSRFDETTIVRLESHLTRILEGMAADAGRPLRELGLLTEPEEQLLREWSRTARDYPHDKTIGELFEEQAAQRPEAIAVSFRGQAMTYGELERRSNRLAHHLRGLGVGPEVRVGVTLERSLELPVALLGIVKAGGAYVPLDPSYPMERRAFMVEDSGVGVLLTQERLLSELPSSGARVVCLDRDWEEISRQTADGLKCFATAENLAYVTYTSGSTGVPKGVEVRQRGVLRLLFGVDYAEFGPGETFLQLAPVSFDASTLEIWGALLHGGKCVLYPDRVPTAVELGEVISGEGVTTLWLTASLYNAVLDEHPEALRGLKQLLIGGEALSVKHVRRGLELLPGTRIINGYGPTESTTFTCCYPIPPELPEGVGSIPIGRPIANTRVYVLDEEMRQAPIGVAGELFIGGDGLARGYLNRPELTAEKFVPDLFSAEGGGRLYRTGDLVKWRADGTIEFLGRTDHQVKVRGFRIELGEIEAALGRHPGVREAVALMREDAPGEKRLVGYVVPAEGRTSEAAELRAYLKTGLPEYMVPSAFVYLESLPLTPNGKVDRGALPVPEGRAAADEALVPPRNDLERRIVAIWKDVLHLEQVGVHGNFFDLGGNSLTLLRFHGRLCETQPDATIVDLFEYPTVSALAAHLSRKVLELEAVGAEARPSREGRGGDEGIAIIGMAGRFPGAQDLDEFWRNLRDGVESITFFSNEELEAEGIPAALCRDERFVKARGVVEGADLFDATFFGYNPREAETIDPQQRVFLETAWTALEKAGYDGESHGGRIGVYAGTGMNTYLFTFASGSESTVLGVDRVFPALLISSDKDFLTTRVSYKLNLHGPSVDVQTACSTSLVAVHLACQSLRTHECDMALAGGVSIAARKGGHIYQQGGILSPDGHCRAFDRKAEGTLGGDGVGVVVLKRLSDALRDGDVIEAVIKGSAINNDGAMKVGYTAPGVEGQAEVIAMAQAKAGVTPESIGYIEAHGTGTALGDPIEIRALRQVFGDRDGRNSLCAIGSVKTNFGHLDAAAGVAGLIKTVLALKHGQIPPSLHFEEANPSLDLSGSPFRVNARLSEWSSDGKPRRAGVSAFGVGGTNAHVVLEEAPLRESAELSRRPCEVLVLSAKTRAALDQATRNLASHLEENPELDLADAAYTLQVGRRAFRHRRIVLCGDVAEARRALEGQEPGRLLDGQAEHTGRAVAFLFPGQGAQHTNMGLGLYRTEEVFKAEVDRCAESLRSELGFDLRDVLYPGEGKEADASRRLEDTAVAQPALFVVEYALARLWMEWGVKPEAMLGHSVGEYVAACLAGVFSLEDALSVVATRGRLMQGMPKGSMVAVSLSEQEVLPLLDGSLGVAAVNGPSQCVVSGPEEEVASLESRLGARGAECQRLRTSHAFHSVMMEPMLSAFRERVSGVERHAPRIPYISNLTGTWIAEKDAVDPGYWVRHLRETVRFSDGLSELLKEGARVLLEVGPGQTLKGLARQHPDCGPEQVAIASARHPRESKPDEQVLAGALGRLWLAGVDVDWAGLRAGEHRRRVVLPTYPFERQRHAIDARRVQPAMAPEGKKADIAEWFYRPTWRSSAPSPGDGHALVNDGSVWLVFSDASGLGSRLTQRLEGAGRRVISVTPGERFERRQANAYAIRPGEATDYEALLHELRGQEAVPDRIAHLWGVTAKDEPAPSVERSLDLGFWSLVFLAQALGSESVQSEVGITVVTSGMVEVGGEGLACPEKATVLGPCRVIPSEYANVSCRAVDVMTPESGVWRDSEIERLLAECGDRLGEPVVAHRRNERWVQSFEAVRLEARERAASRLRENGVYLITGGLGGIGLELAQFLVDSVHARVVLLGRTGLPPREEWEAWLSTHDEVESTSRRIRKVEALEASGGEVLVLSADVSDRRQMEEAFATAEARFGEIHGVIHSAGVAPGGVIQLKTRDMAERVLAPKVTGTLVLESLLEDRHPDFVVLCSSLSSVLGLPGQVDYCAANAFQDAFARRQAGLGGQSVLSLNWDTWREAGMAVEGEAPRPFRDDLPARLASDDGILSKEGAEVFARALGQPLPQLLVSTVELAPRIAHYRALNKTPAVEASQETSSRHPRPQLATPYVMPGNEVEQTIAEVWQELLGFERVGIHDNFFDLGGHSLLALQVVNRLRQTFQVPLKLQTLFDAPTVVELARAIVESEPRPGHAREIARLARSIDSLSDEEVEQMLQEQRAHD